ncbi:MAG: hypothetical protein ACI4TR_03200, partial [Bacteroidaceae bacterium]
MKKFLLSLTIAIIGAIGWQNANARIVQSERIPANLVKAGDTIALECGTPGSNSNYFLGINENGELRNVTPFSSRTAWIVSEGPLNHLGEKTYYLQNLSNLKFLGCANTEPMVNGTGSLGMKEDIEYALPLSIYLASDSSEVADQYGPIWDSNSGVFCFNQDDGTRNFIANCGHWGIATVWFWQYKDTNAWNIYQVYYEHDLQGDLLALIEEISEAGIEYEAGTAPGLYPQDKVDAFNAALEEGLLLTMEEHTDAEYQAAIDKILQTKKDVENSVNPIIEGYYYVVSSYPQFLNKQGVEKAWVANSNTLVGWKTFDYLDPAQIFKFTPLPSGNFTIQNYDNDQYVNGAERASVGEKIMFTSTPGYEQIAKPIGSLQWIFYNSNYNVAYHPQDHSTGNGSGGDLCAYNNNAINDISTWFIRVVPDSVMEKMPAIKAQNAINSQLSALVTEANNIYDKLIVYTVSPDGLITNATDDDPGNQVSSNAKDPQQGTYAALIDGTTEFFHSTWHPDNDPLTAPHNLQFNISETPASGFQMKMIQRCDSWGDQDRPTLINFYATNDPTAEDAWTFIRQVNVKGQWPNNSDHQNKIVLPTIDLGATYGYIRMDVIETERSRKNTGAQYPFFSLAELQIYPVVPNKEASQYYYTEGLAPLADRMQELANAAVDKINNSTATQEDIEELKTALANVKTLYADTTEVASLIATLSDYATTSVIGEGLGETTQDAVDALKAAVDEAKQSGFTTPLVKAEIDAALAKLNDAKDKFMATIKMPEPGKWYYILSASNTETHFNGGDENDPLPVANSALYADGPNSGDHIRYGLLTENAEPNYTYNPNAMWRLIEVEGTNQYALQCLGTGQYMGNGSTKINASIYSSQQPVPYSINLLGNASFGLIPQANQDTKNGLVACFTGQHAEVNEVSVYGDGSWKFVELDPENTDLIMISTFAYNLIDVIAMPYDIANISDYNEDVHIYGIKKMTKNSDNTTSVELYEKESAKAGESCIIILGNPAEECESNELVIPFPTEVTNQATPQNGIYGMICSESTPAGTAYSDGSQFVCNTEREVGIGAYTGAINTEYYTGEVADVETALTLTIKDLAWANNEPTGDVNGDGAINSSDVVAI